MANEPDFILSDGKSGKAWGMNLDGGASAVRMSVVSEDRAAIDIRSQNKRIGDFDEQRDWKGGHAHDFLSEQPDGYYDGSNVWTINKTFFHNSLQHKFAKGYRDSNFYMPGDMSWRPLYNGVASNCRRYIARPLVANTYASGLGKIQVWARRVGTPGSFFALLKSNSAGNPGTVLATSTARTVADSPDTVSLILEFSMTYAMVAGTTYWIELYDDGTGSANNHWEIGCDLASPDGGRSSTNDTVWVTTTDGLYYRMTDVDIDRRFFFFLHGLCMYAVSRNANETASKLYINGDRGVATAGSATTLTDTRKSGVWETNGFSGAKLKIVNGTGQGQTATITSNTTTVLTFPTLNVALNNTSEYIIYNTPTFTEITGHGLGVVLSEPVSFGVAAYFPQGSTAIRRMRWNAAAAPPAHEFAADGTNTAKAFVVANDAAGGPRIWGITITGGDVAWSASKAWGTNLVFTTIALGGNPLYGGINGIEYHQGLLYVIKDDSAWSVSGAIPTLLGWGLDKTPSILNGISIISDQNFLYFSRLHSTMRVFGGSATDIGVSWRGTDLKEEKQGYVAEFEAAIGWIFTAINAGLTGRSTVHIYDGFNWHEFFDAYKVGARIRDIKWQAMEDSYYRLWIDIGGDIMYVDFPPYTNAPTYASGIPYQHESVIVSSTIDMGTSARLPKYIKSLAAVTKNLGDGKYIGVDYQVDSDIGSNNWIPLAPLSVSAEDETLINVGNITKFRYRFRLNTNSATTPVIVYGVAPNGFARIPFKLSWTVRVKAGELQQFGGSQTNDPQLMLRWLISMARSPNLVRMTSTKYPLMDGFFVTLSPPTVMPERPATAGAPWQGVIPFTIQEI